MAAPVDVSVAEARRIHLGAQGLLGRRMAGGPAAVLEATRGIQLDTISVLARSHELMAYARLGPLPRARIETALWGGPPYRGFESWYHAACVVPIEEWPNFAFKRDARRRRGFRWHRLADAEASCASVMAQIRERGALTAKELGGAKRGGPWWDWSETKIAAEWLLDIGELACTTRRGFQRVYDLPERVIPPELLAPEVPREAAIRILAERAVTALGIATASDVAQYVGVKRIDAVAALRSSRLDVAAVAGWAQPAYLMPGALEHPALSPRSRRRAVLLSPFDGIVCDRVRLERFFGFFHRLEAYVPRPRRVHGYYTMPLLAGDQMVGRADPARQGRTLVARGVFLEPLGSHTAKERAGRAMGSALAEAARWVDCDQVALERVEPEDARPVIEAALRS